MNLADNFLPCLLYIADQPESNKTVWCASENSNFFQQPFPVVELGQILLLLNLRIILRLLIAKQTLFSEETLRPDAWTLNILGGLSFHSFIYLEVKKCPFICLEVKNVDSSLQKTGQFHQLLLLLSFLDWIGQQAVFALPALLISSSGCKSQIGWNFGAHVHQERKTRIYDLMDGWISQLANCLWQ